MKANMNNWSVEEITSHLEIYGDGFDGNILRTLEAMKDERDCAIDEVTACGFANNDDEIDRLENENEELHEKLQKITEILNGGSA